MLEVYLHECLAYYDVDPEKLDKFHVHFTTSQSQLLDVATGFNKSTLGTAIIKSGRINIYVKTQAEFYQMSSDEIDAELLSLYLTLTLIHEIDHLLQPYSKSGEERIADRDRFFLEETVKHMTMVAVLGAVMIGLDSKISKHHFDQYSEFLQENLNYREVTQRYKTMTRRVFLGRMVTMGLTLTGGFGIIARMLKKIDNYYEIDPIEMSARDREEDFIESKRDGNVFNPEFLLVRATMKTKKD